MLLLGAGHAVEVKTPIYLYKNALILILTNMIYRSSSESLWSLCYMHPNVQCGSLHHCHTMATSSSVTNNKPKCQPVRCLWRESHISTFFPYGVKLFCRRIAWETWTFDSVIMRDFLWPNFLFLYKKKKIKIVRDFHNNANTNWNTWHSLCLCSKWQPTIFAIMQSPSENGHIARFLTSGAINHFCNLWGP